ncbi:hypothetical protein GALMADRAFT_143473 [Galerina marginata CBS 339.88]|uniref:BZIP domain-containing protein n=1 Tax=Galerina marginata (strain CBS 339.88) TaxID=685588 RepID=A0A067SWT8_GALM3|nr:hypothetical protein GALMADRAFT_143473 [Galerina marginata CBS 339.88]
MAANSPIRERKRVSQKKYYAINLETERQKGRSRAERLKMSRTLEDIESHRARHRLAQARYRAANKLKLKTESWQYRIKKKRGMEREQDEIDYEEMMASV